MDEQTTIAPGGRIFAALAKAQGAFKPVVKNLSYRLKTGAVIHYADLGAVYDATLPALHANGIAVTHKIRSGDGGVTVETILCHESGETISSGPFTVPASGGNNTAQAYGSARTYACRYSLCSVLAVAAEDDDDGLSAHDGRPQGAQRRDPPTNNGGRPIAKGGGSPLSRELIDKATAFARMGMAKYRSFCDSLPQDQRNVLFKSSLHADLKKTATEVDQGAQQ